MEGKKPTEIIQAWLDDEQRDYQQGRMLFEKYSRNRSLQLFFARKESMSKLMYELGKLAGRSAIVTPVGKVKEIGSKKKERIPAAGKVTPPVADSVVETPFKRVDRATLPFELQEVYDDISEKYKHLRAVHEKMKIAATDEDRAHFRNELSTLDDAIAAGWTQIDSHLAGVTGGNRLDAPPPTHQDSGSTLSAKEATKRATSISRTLTALMEERVPEEKVHAAKLKVADAARQLAANGHTFSPATLEKFEQLGIVLSPPEGSSE